MTQLSPWCLRLLQWALVNTIVGSFKLEAHFTFSNREVPQYKAVSDMVFDLNAIGSNRALELVDPPLTLAEADTLGAFIPWVGQAWPALHHELHGNLGLQYSGKESYKGCAWEDSAQGNQFLERAVNFEIGVDGPPTSLKEWAHYRFATSQAANEAEYAQYETHNAGPNCEKAPDPSTGAGAVVSSNDAALPEQGLQLVGSVIETTPVHGFKPVFGHKPKGTDQLDWQLLATQGGRFLWYDGFDLMSIDISDGQVKRSWQAFSGRPGTTASRDSKDLRGQHAKSVGPTPEGVYAIPTSETLSRDQADGAWDWIKWTYKAPAWGLYSTPLAPVLDTDTHGRSNMFLHGGSTPGSAGCIDLVAGNKDLHEYLRDLPARAGQQVTEWTARLLVVQYLPIRTTLARTHEAPNNCPDRPQGGPDSARHCVGSSYCSVEAKNQLARDAERPAMLAELLLALRL